MNKRSFKMSHQHITYISIYEMADGREACQFRGDANPILDVTLAKCMNGTPT